MLRQLRCSSVSVSKNARPDIETSKRKQFFFSHFSNYTESKLKPVIIAQSINMKSEIVTRVTVTTVTKMWYLYKLLHIMSCQVTIISWLECEWRYLFYLMWSGSDSFIWWLHCEVTCQPLLCGEPLGDLLWTVLTNQQIFCTLLYKGVSQFAVHMHRITNIHYDGFQYWEWTWCGTTLCTQSKKNIFCNSCHVMF